MPTFKVVNVIPNSHSNETNQDCEPSIAVNPVDPRGILISTFTPPDSGQTNGGLFVSQDGGDTWDLAFIIPGGEPLDQTYGFGGNSGEFYGGDISGTSDPSGGTIILNSLSTPNPFVPGTMAVLEHPTPTDQPYIASTTVRFGADTGKDRFYVGYNDQRQAGSTGQTAAIDFCLDATAASPVISTVHLDTRTTADWTTLGIAGPFNQDGPQVRTTVNGDGTIYATFNGVRTMTSSGAATSDIVVVRDDNWASGANPFTALVDPNDGKAGFRVQTGVSLVWSPGSPNLGQERAFGTFAIATHPGDSDIVYLAWAGVASGKQTIHLQRSLNRGVSWSGDLLTPIPNATNAALAINTAGVIGLLYQQLTGTSPSDRWETHFRQSSNGTTWSDATVCTTPAGSPPVFYDGFNHLPYLGDYLELVAVGKTFYGTFCANNTPDPANFPATPATASNPNGAIFQRNVTTSSPWNLLGSDDSTTVAVSIDPFFLQVQEVAVSSDFYVRDWTSTPTIADNGAEPSLNNDFWDFSDVWNQNSSSVANPPNANDQPQSENALAGADNYGFARIRRNQLPAAGSGAVTVTAHFLISEFGTGSNFVDEFFSDPSDPDVTFAGGDVTVSFAETDLGPLVTPPTTWTLAATTSDHLCIAVEITSAGDPFSAPGLTGRAPGQAGATLAVINDNNKAQRNLHVTPAAAGGMTRFGIVHNGATTARDMTLGFLGTLRAPEGTLVEIFTEKGVVARVPWKAWGTFTLPNMQPGENRWVGLTIPKLPAAGTSIVGIAEMKGGRPVNGFSMGAELSPIGVVIGYLTGYHERTLTRLHLGFGIGTGTKGGGAGHPGGRGKEGGEFDFEEKVRVEEHGLRIEIDVRVRRGGDRHEHHEHHGGSSKPPVIGPAQYEAWLRAQVVILSEALTALAAGDPFGIAAAIALLEAAAAGDLIALTSAHDSVLNRFDAFLTMLQKAKGDRADILQMALWNRDLTERASISALPAAVNMRHRLQKFIDAVDARTAHLNDYGTLLTQIAGDLHQVAAARGATATLNPLIADLSSAGSARTQEKAHRDLLLALEKVV